MDIYKRKSRWKLYLGVAGALIVAISMVYTSYLTGKLAEEERSKVALYVEAQERFNNQLEMEAIQENGCPEPDFTLHLLILQSNNTIPVIAVNEQGRVDFTVNVRDTSQAYLLAELAQMDEEGFQPIQSSNHRIYYKESTLLQQLRYFPFVQLFLIAAFVAFGYLGFSSTRRAEQNRVWVGMAKETAHQLGTPISAIVAWIEHLKLIRDEDEEVQEVVTELRNDVSRLELIADRFSKIGSAPKLDPINVFEELEQCRAYMQRRASRKVAFQFPDPGSPPQTIHINSHLFDWVVENLLRNALDAMDGQGEISAEVYDDNDFVYIDITDTGKGIPDNRFKTVFQPGFTTKKRGWGLGLSLAKRIIEEYHNGKIFVKRSEEGVGTTFTIQLPKL
ncbi:sensor histidine kinase [Phaeodactylibacter luteus]|uniref:histidine kinase n=1 Tax=Phaeodactylibacter luteus TaxID=1564516 RepID=A0A5C6RT32_9BACT|nr:HAMP domain-containing sensor histidine kinase [Phaeodactylibacter luteus]TXB65606.1 HAMP domain-containing histidine kinase [Phaeodactylibacter luteus]